MDAYEAAGYPEDGTPTTMEELTVAEEVAGILYEQDPGLLLRRTKRKKQDET